MVFFLGQNQCVYTAIFEMANSKYAVDSLVESFGLQHTPHTILP